MKPSIRHDWSVKEVEALFALPFHELSFRAQEAHRMFQPVGKVQLCTLSNIKSGGCPEDCAYCPQSARHNTGLQPERLIEREVVLEQALLAKDNGSTRFCMGAAWREVRNNKDFDEVVEMVRDVGAIGLEVCCTLGMLSERQAQRLADAGLTAYNHNIDTSPEHYAEIISTRGFEDRLRTIENVRNAGIQVCSGGIIGMGEKRWDRARMLQVLANMDPHPESVPINSLVQVEGTPLENEKDVSVWDFLRMLAVARVLMPDSMIRLAAGRTRLNQEAQAMAFQLGANSIFYGEKLLTTGNPEMEKDRKLLAKLGLEPLEARPTHRHEIRLASA